MRSHGMCRTRSTALFALTFLCAGCAMTPPGLRYPHAIDACQLPDAASFNALIPGTVEVPPGSVPAPTTSVQPADLSDGDSVITTCPKVYARDLGGNRPDTKDFRSVTITVVRYTGSDAQGATTKAGRLMTGEMGDHSGVQSATGIGDEAGYTATWAAARAGNVLVELALTDGGSEAALIPAPTSDMVKQALGGLMTNLQKH